jgi:rhodanese-related sulfurtransferase
VDQVVQPSIRPSIPEIDVNELDELLSGCRVLVLDVREEWEFRRGRVPGAVSVPLRQLAAEIGALRRDKPYAVICEHGHRSLVATEFMMRNGFAGVASVRGGTSAWALSLRELEKD